jgi:phosphatidylinositol glycan class W
MLAVLIMTGYEIALNSLNLKNYIFYAPRVDMISANREGIYSSFGYVALMLIGMTFGR